MEEWDRSMDTVPSGSQVSLVTENQTLRFTYKVCILKPYPGSISIRRNDYAIEKLNRLDGFTEQAENQGKQGDIVSDDNKHVPGTDCRVIQ